METITELWAEFWNTGSPPLREFLILHYRRLAQDTVPKLMVPIPKSMTKADLEEVALTALGESVDRYTPEIDPRFEHYAISHIRGQILQRLWAERESRAAKRDDVNHRI